MNSDAITRPALLLIAHGSRRAEANADLEDLAAKIRGRGVYHHVQAAYLELCPPDIVAGGVLCVEAGAAKVILLPYFLSAGIHVADDLTAARDELKKRFPAADFVLAQPLGRHPLLAEIVLERAAAAH
jgi:sirohydrochlorin ferrochelatase